MEVKLGIIHSARELSVETEQSAEEVAGEVEAALSAAAGLIWLTDVKGRRVGVPVDKLAYVELGEENAGKRVGFGAGR